MPGTHDNTKPAQRIRYEHDVQRIENMYAWVATNTKTGRQGLVWSYRNGVAQPFIATTLRQIVAMQREAINATRNYDVQLTCIQFEAPVELALPPPTKQVPMYTREHEARFIEKRRKKRVRKKAAREDAEDAAAASENAPNE